MTVFFGLSALLLLTGLEKDTETAAQQGLSWLARHQEEDGSWKEETPRKNCKDLTCGAVEKTGHSVGKTGLALVAFFKAKEAKLSNKDYDKEIERGLQWLVKQQNEEGRVGEIAGEFFYNQNLAAYALACAVRTEKFRSYQPALQKAVSFLLKNQNSEKTEMTDAKPNYLGWRYRPNDGQSDTSATSWAFLALREAELAGVPILKTHFEGILRWVRKVTNSKGAVGYLSPEDAGLQIKVPQKNEKYRNHQALTAAGVFIHFLSAKLRYPVTPALRWGAKELEPSIEILSRDLPSWDQEKLGNDYYYWHHGSMAMQFAGAKPWKQWKEALQKCLVPNQRKESNLCAFGSWDPTDRWSFGGGRVYATAINVISLTVGLVQETSIAQEPVKDFQELPLKRWAAIGPFPLDPVEKLSKQVYPPEKEKLDLNAKYTLPSGKTFSWQPADAEQSGQLNLRTLFNFDERIAYAVAFARSEIPQQASIELQFDDGIEVYLNEKKVFNSYQFSKKEMTTSVVSVDLEKENKIFVKSYNKLGDWKIRVTIRSRVEVQEIPP